MIPAIAEAVREHRLLTFSYEDLPRTVEPHQYGIHRDTGNEVLSGYQVGGSSHSSDRPGWRNFLVTEIRNLGIADDSFDRTRQGYNPNDPRFKVIFARA